MGFDLGSLLQQYVDGATPSSLDAQNHFQQATQAAPPDLITQALGAMFRSDATPAFGQMAGQLFGQASPNQQAGMLNQLIAGMGPTVLASLLGGSGGSALGNILGQLTGGGTGGTVTPAQASTLTPEQVQVIASHAEQQDPGIVDRLSGFFAQNPGLVKTLGTAALSIALAKMAEHSGSRPS